MKKKISVLAAVLLAIGLTACERAGYTGLQRCIFIKITEDREVWSCQREF